MSSTFENLHVGIQLTESCDLACRHCCTTSSPKVTTTLDREYVRDILRQAADIDPHAEVVFTGGEVFYVRDLLYYAIGVVRELGLGYSINTNGSWAVDPAECREVLDTILDVRRIAFGTDDYHDPAVPKRAVGRALQEAMRSGVPAMIRYTFAAGEDFEQVYRELGLTTEEERARVEFSGIMPVGRAVRLDPTVFPVFPEREPCFAANTIMIRSTGVIYGCCGDSMYLPGKHDLRHGHVKTTPLKEVLSARESNVVLQTIRTIGPRPLAVAAGAIRDTPEDEMFSRSPCGSCHLMLQERNKDKTRAAAEEFRDRVTALRAFYYGEI
ncbi:radical SAM protein [Streptosporangiaceae bacterium NEAU-GS5]|nr:radical SAM protein [Streptosporangiaceae bacterium NEAU-GS5]